MCTCSPTATPNCAVSRSRNTGASRASLDVTSWADVVLNHPWLTPRIRRFGSSSSRPRWVAADATLLARRRPRDEPERSSVARIAVLRRGRPRVVGRATASASWAARVSPPLPRARCAARLARLVRRQRARSVVKLAGAPFATRERDVRARARARSKPRGRARRRPRPAPRAPWTPAFAPSPATAEQERAARVITSAPRRPKGRRSPPRWRTAIRDRGPRAAGAPDRPAGPARSGSGCAPTVAQCSRGARTVMATARRRTRARDATALERTRLRLRAGRAARAERRRRRAPRRARSRARRSAVRGRTLASSRHRRVRRAVASTSPRKASRLETAAPSACRRRTRPRPRRAGRATGEQERLRRLHRRRPRHVIRMPSTPRAGTASRRCLG